jgi:vacuolar-type H+-ATPase subunit H
LNLGNIKRDERKMEKEIKKILEIERESRKIIEEAQNKADSLKADAEKESRKIIMNARKEAKKIVDSYKSNLSTEMRKERKEVEEKSTSLRKDWIKRYEVLKKELLAELTGFLLGS